MRRVDLIDWSSCPFCGSSEHEHLGGYEQVRERCLRCGSELAWPIWEKFAREEAKRARGTLKLLGFRVGSGIDNNEEGMSMSEDEKDEATPKAKPPTLPKKVRLFADRDPKTNAAIFTCDVVRSSDDYEATVSKDEETGNVTISDRDGAVVLEGGKAPEFLKISKAAKKALGL